MINYLAYDRLPDYVMMLVYRFNGVLLCLMEKLLNM